MPRVGLRRQPTKPRILLAVNRQAVKDYFPNYTTNPLNVEIGMDQNAMTGVIIGLSVVVFLLSLIIGIFGP